MVSANSPDGQPQAHGGYPVQNHGLWDPAALLNPKTAASSSHPTLKPSGSNTSLRPATNGPEPADRIVFQFSTPGDNMTPEYPAFQPAAPQNGRLHGLPTTPIFQNGFSHQIERLSNVLDRSDVPQPKRRKTETEEIPETNGNFHGSSSGILSDFIKEKHDEAKTDSGSEQHEVVDLTRSEAAAIVVEELKDALGSEEVCFGMLEGTSINCHKVPSPKPGMVPIGGDNYWPQVKVVLRRRVGDPNKTIHVYDWTREVFGVVDAKVAEVLAPLLESKLQIRTDCRIPGRKKIPGERIGEAISRAFLVELMLYGPRKYAKQVGNYLARFSLKLISPTRVQPGLKVVNPHVKEARTPPVTPRSWSGSELTSHSHQHSHSQPGYTRTVEEIRSEVMGVFDSLPKSEDLPEFDPDDCVQTPLLKHQRQALYFMLSRERDGMSGVQNGETINSSWQPRRDKNGSEFFYNVITNQEQRERPRSARGGILADMMGLGKTLSVLALLTKTMGEAAEWGAQAPIQPRAPEKRHGQPPRQFDIPRPQSFGLTTLQRNGKATLLICPLSTITNWEEQIKQHIMPKTLTYHIYHGPNRIKDVAMLADFDLVITTYGSVSSELTARARNKRPPFPLEEIGWFRIVLDEAHIIREQNTLGFKSVCRLQASRRWAVTGTPIQNKLEDLGSLLSFLRLSPFDEKSKFFQYIITPFKNADPEIVPKLRVLIDTITLRRLKDKINLPKRTDTIVRLDFSPDERRIYEPFAQNAKERVKSLTGQPGQDRIIGGKTYIHILRAILRLRLICAHGKDLLNDEDLELLQGTSAATPIDLDSDEDETKPALQESKAYDIFYYLQESNNDKCGKCNRKLGSDAAEVDSERQEDTLCYMAPCFHVYCPVCVDTLRVDFQIDVQASSQCDTCANTEKTNFVELRRTRAEFEHEARTCAKSKEKSGRVSPNDYIPHTKTRALVEDLLNSKEEGAKNPDEPPLKSVIFSGWTSHLDLIEIALDKAGITYTRLDGKMTRTARSAAMDSFRDDPSVDVILVSIMAGGLGLNLTSGNTVYVMEPQFNPAAEAQAIDRVHRLGQKRPVRTIRYIMKDSFEEKMLELQEKKKQLASLSMDGRDKDKVMDRTEAARQRLMDLRSLFR